MAVISELCCPKCEYQSPSKTVFQCPNCKSILEVNVEINHLTRSDFDTMRRSRDRTIWRWFDFFPIENRSSIVSLGEGCTPLIHSKRLGEHLGLSRFYLKNDTVLPTGSLKDRSNSVGLSVAKELGFMTATVMSTGNAAASVAAYSAAAGLKNFFHWAGSAARRGLWRLKAQQQRRLSRRSRRGLETSSLLWRGKQSPKASRSEIPCRWVGARWRRCASRKG